MRRYDIILVYKLLIIRVFFAFFGRWVFCGSSVEGHCIIRCPPMADSLDAHAMSVAFQRIIGWLENPHLFRNERKWNAWKRAMGWWNGDVFRVRLHRFHEEKNKAILTLEY